MVVVPLVLLSIFPDPLFPVPRRAHIARRIRPGGGRLLRRVHAHPALRTGLVHGRRSRNFHALTSSRSTR